MRAIVIGGGPAGMTAAAFLGKNGFDVKLIEKNEKLGKKLYITGKGRCNLTNNCSPNEFLENIVVNPKFMYSAINSFSPSDTLDWFKSFGLSLKEERGKRVFPSSDKSSDVIKTMGQILSKNHVEVILNCEAMSIIKKGEVFSIDTSKGNFECDRVVIATGGLSYPSTGSTGDGYVFARKLGHTIIDTKPSLVSISIKERFVKSLEGLSLKNVVLSSHKNGKTLFCSEIGEMLFTDSGISGPLVLTLSSIINKLNLSELDIKIDLKPALSMDTLDRRILSDFDKNNKRQFKNALNDLLPTRLIPVIISMSKIDENKQVSQITKEERLALVGSIKEFTISPLELQDIKYAVVTSGGVNINEINPKTMESKLIPNLFFVGEVLDVDALTGGFNIQIALSTGFLAGNKI